MLRHVAFVCVVSALSGVVEAARYKVSLRGKHHMDGTLPPGVEEKTYSPFMLSCRVGVKI